MSMYWLYGHCGTLTDPNGGGGGAGGEGGGGLGAEVNATTGCPEHVPETQDSVMV